MRSILGLTSLLLACGGAATTAQPVTVGQPADAGVAVAPPPARTASEPIAKAWPIDDPLMLLYIDTESALRPDLALPKLLPVLDGLASKSTPSTQLACIREAVFAAKEIVIGARDGMLLIARFDPAHAPKLRPCFAATVDAVAVRGADEAWAADEGDVAAISRELFFVGSKRLVESAIERKGESTAVLRRFGLLQGEIARIHVDSGIVVDGTFSASPTRLSATFGVELHSAEQASSVAAQMGQLASQIPPSASAAERESLTRLINALHTSAHGKHLDALLSLEEPAVDQARDLGGALAFAKRGIDEYLLASKEAEARNAVGAIAKDIVVSWEREEMTASGKIASRKSKKLTSFPPVPSTVPRAIAVTTKADDWKAWAPIHFEIDAPQRYQYEVRAAKDGKSASVIARGDLNGDGKTSLFELTLQVDAQQHIVVAPALKETDPDE